MKTRPADRVTEFSWLKYLLGSQYRRADGSECLKASYYCLFVMEM